MKLLSTIFGVFIYITLLVLGSVMLIAILENWGVV